MKTINGHDLFNAARIIKELGLKEEVKEICQKSERVGDIWGKGFDFVYTIFEKATTENAENLIFEFLGNLFEIPANEMKNGNLLDTIELLTNKDNVKELKAFFTKLASLITTLS